MSDADRFYPMTLHTGEAIWVPSVTTILGIIDKPALTRWKQEQAIYAAAHDLYRLGHYQARYDSRQMADVYEAVPEKFAPDGDLMPYNFFAEANVRDWLKAAEAFTEQTARLGSYVHAIVNRINRGDNYLALVHEHEAEFPDIPAIVAPYLDFFEKHVEAVLATEQVVYGEVTGHGGRSFYYAGTLDEKLRLRPGTKLGHRGRVLRQSEVAYCDVKTGTDYHDQYGLQLAGYRLAEYSQDPLTEPGDCLLTLRLDRERHKLYIKEWENPEQLELAFMSLVETWHRLNPDAGEKYAARLSANE